MRKEEKEESIKLRKKGYSYSYISEQLNIAKGTLSYWLSDIPYTPNQETEIRIKESRLKMIEYKKEEKKKTFLKAKEIAIDDIGEINERDLFMLGLGLYIGEGSKSHDIIRVINANPAVINLSIKWFEVICGLKKENFSVGLHIYPDNSIKECIEFWIKTTGLSLKNFRKIQIDTRKDKSMIRKKKLLFGTAHINIISNGNPAYGVRLHRRIMGWISGVLEKN